MEGSEMLRGLAVTAVLTLFATFASAQSADVDWKYYGRAVLNKSTGKIELTCFFDANSIDHPTRGHVRVWTKCLDERDMHSFDYHSDLTLRCVGPRFQLNTTANLPQPRDGRP